MLLLAVAVAGCGGGSPTQPNQSTGGNNSPPPQTGGGPGLAASVTVSDNQFTPNEVTILKTGTVTWTWSNGGYGTPHNVTFSDADSGDKTDGQYQRSFANAGTYTYKCTNHSGMTGTVKVQ